MKRAAVVLLLLSLGACKRAPEATKDAGTPGVAVTPAAPAETTAPVFDPAAPPPHEIPPAEAPRDPHIIKVGEEVIPGAPAPSAPPPDPFEPVIASVRSAAVGCFAGQPPGEYSASISVFVTPAGTASSVSVTSGPTDDAIRKCLVQAATRSYPSSADGRKLSIDVLVKG